MKKIFFIIIVLASINIFAQKKDVLLQGFYWLVTPGGGWYDTLRANAQDLQKAGFTGIWMPPAAKGDGAKAHGYDIYDYYDLGEFNQKGSTETRYGSRAELDQTVKTFKKLGIELYFDAIMNHRGWADARAPYTCGKDSGWVIFNPASGRFPGIPEHFHPNAYHCGNEEPYFSKSFFEDVSQGSSAGDSLIAWGEWILKTVKFDGFRLDAIKHIEPKYIARFSQHFKGRFILGEFWDNADNITKYYNEVKSYGGDLKMFDFPLRDAIRDMCNEPSGAYNVQTLVTAGLRHRIGSSKAVTFVDNHDVDRQTWNNEYDGGHFPVRRDKHLGYALIMFMDVQPMVWYRDYYFNGYKDVINKLIKIRYEHLAGDLVFNDAGWVSYGFYTKPVDLLIAKREGKGKQKGGILLINDDPSKTHSATVKTKWKNTLLRDALGNNPDVKTDNKGVAELSCVKRNAAIYIPVKK